MQHKIMLQKYRIEQQKFRTEQQIFRTIVKIIIIQQKYRIGTPYYYYPMKNFNLRVTIEDSVPGQYKFHPIIFKCQDHNIAIKKRQEIKFDTI